MYMEKLVDFKELSEVELENIDGGEIKAPGWWGLIQPVYDFGYGVGHGFAKTVNGL